MSFSSAKIRKFVISTLQNSKYFFSKNVKNACFGGLPLKTGVLVR